MEGRNHHAKRTKQRTIPALEKMDGSCLVSGTVIPNWVVDNVFNIRGRFSKREKSNPLSQAHISINHGGGKAQHAATVTTRCGGIPVMRLYFGDDVASWLKDVYRMTYARYVERLKHDINGPTIEKLIPFWEFIDIEWEEAFRRFISRDGTRKTKSAHQARTTLQNFLSKKAQPPSQVKRNPPIETMARQCLAKRTYMNASICASATWDSHWMGRREGSAGTPWMMEQRCT